MDTLLLLAGAVVFAAVGVPVIVWVARRIGDVSMLIPDGAREGLAGLPASQYVEASVVDWDGIELRRIVVLVRRDGLVITVEPADPGGWIHLGSEETLVVLLTDGVVFTMSAT